MAESQKTVLRIPGNAVMTHFCYDYAKALFDGLKELEKKDAVFECGFENGNGNFTSLATALIAALKQQICLKMSSKKATTEEFDSFMETAIGFLRSFAAK